MEAMQEPDWKLTPVAQPDLEAVLPQVHPWLKDVEKLVSGKLTYPQLIDGIYHGRAQLWLVKRDAPVAAIVTEILTYPSVRYCHVMIVSGGGNAKEWHRPVIEQIEGWAKRQGCDKVEMYGRKGWLRLLPEYRIKQYRMEKEL